ncbi:hypothetical protein [Algoriphagus sp. A40]|uniref:hypothetical protein n=1 Tax=Algoriphagus sp. A40 TaxID=1945863 RepID=UPI000987A0D3|nr:hypothetical protein [Algoriphagus sp. A40]OOG72294.1 hypothetical protein B0E43_15445 [Algoriphagus sp. A40]
MTKMTFKSALGSTLVLLALSLAMMAFTPMKGMDSYEISLNGKLIMKQYVNQPLNLRMLELENAQAQDQLSIRYTHCTIKGAGSDRTLVLKDEAGHVLKQWEFANNPKENNAMSIRVGELLQLEKDHKDHRITLTYQANELKVGELLAFLQLD